MPEQTQSLYSRISYYNWRLRPRRRLARGVLEPAALIDLLLLLGLFAVAYSPFILQPGVRLELPELAFEEGVPPFGSFILVASGDELLFFEDEVIPMNRLEGVLTKAYDADPGRPLLIEADRRVSQGRLTQMYAAARAAGVTQVVLSTRPPASSSGAAP